MGSTKLEIMVVQQTTQPILITGCARSGTSLVAGAIHLCGAFGGDMSGPNKNNAKGMYENARIRNLIVKPFLNSIHVDPMGQFPLPNIHSIPIPNDWGAKIAQSICREGYNGGSWMYKGAKMCLMWPVWNHAFSDAKWIIVRRSDEGIINSCLKTSFMRAFHFRDTQRKVGANSETEAWLWWIDQHKKRFVEMIEAGLNIKIVKPELMIKGDYHQMYETIEWLGLKWNSNVLSFIDPKLWHSRGKA